MSTTLSDAKSCDSPTWQQRAGALSPLPLTKRESLSPSEEKQPHSSSPDSTRKTGNLKADAPSIVYIHSSQPHSTHPKPLPPREYYLQRQQQHPAYPPQFSSAASNETNVSSYPMQMRTHPMTSAVPGSQHYPYPPAHTFHNTYHRMPAPPMYYPPPPYGPPYQHMYGYPHPHYFLPPPVAAIEYITDIQPQDVLSGRGGTTNSWSGNRLFRRLVKKHQAQYLQAKKRDKPTVAAKVVELIRQQGGRFLKKLDQTDHSGQVLYVDIGDERAKEKACQALREGAPNLKRTQTGKGATEENDKGSSKDESEADERKGSSDGAVEEKPSEEETIVEEVKDTISGAAEVTPIQTLVTNDDDTPTNYANHDGPIMIRPCPRLMPNRKPIEPFPVDQLSPEARDMYLREFLPPSNPPRLKRLRLSSESEGTASPGGMGSPNSLVWPFFAI